MLEEVVAERGLSDAAPEEKDFVGQLCRTLPGRRAGGKNWIDYAAGRIQSRGFERCPSSGQFYWNRELRCLIELHMDDVHGTAPGNVGAYVVADLSAEMALKWSGLLWAGACYEFLRRRRRRTEHATYIQPSDKYLQKVLLSTGLLDASAAPTPGQEAHRVGREQSEALDADAGHAFRSTVMALMYYAHDWEDVQYEVNHIASCVQAPVALDELALKRLVRYLSGARNHGV